MVTRLRRRTFWLACVVTWIVFCAAREGFALGQPGWPGTVWAACALLAVGLFAVARLHDRGRSGWWLAAVLLPVIGALWLAWELAGRRGNAHANQYGPDPLER